jgi:phosphoribosylformimino-5-aminoimidazole carboxamide ribotide isomerase
MWGADKIAVGIDARDGKVATHGWKETSDVDAVDFGHTMRAMGVKRVIYTDISRDGMLSGVNLAATSHLGNVTDLQVIASGGVASIKDIEDLKGHEFYNVEGVIVGQAIYTGNLDLAQAIQVGHGPLTRHSAGIVPFRRTPDGLRLLLLWNACLEEWQFPRGTVERGESDWDCARREFDHATGLSILTEKPRLLPVLAYTTKVRAFTVQRTVAYHLAEIGPGEVCMGCDNHGEAFWVSLDEAADMLAETSPEQLPLLTAVRSHFGRERG